MLTKLSVTFTPFPTATLLVTVTVISPTEPRTIPPINLPPSTPLFVTVLESIIVLSPVKTSIPFLAFPLIILPLMIGRSAKKLNIPFPVPDEENTLLLRTCVSLAGAFKPSTSIPVPLMSTIVLPRMIFLSARPLVRTPIPEGLLSDT